MLPDVLEDGCFSGLDALTVGSVRLQVTVMNVIKSTDGL
jgi:hypothetical protein